MAIAATPYRRKAGRCINTAVLGRIHGGRIPEGAVEQSAVKETVEKKGQEAKLDRLFVEYNEAGFVDGLRERLLELFPEPSRWEAQSRSLEKTKETSDE